MRASDRPALAGNAAAKAGSSGASRSTLVEVVAPPTKRLPESSSKPWKASLAVPPMRLNWVHWLLPPALAITPMIPSLLLVLAVPPLATGLLTSPTGLGAVLFEPRESLVQLPSFRAATGA